MNLSETFRVALDSLLINRLRSALTTLGIIIGVGAVISLVSLGRAVEAYIASEFQDLGATLLEIRPMTPESPTRTRIEDLSTFDAEALANPAIAPSIRRVAMSFRVFASIVANGERSQLNIAGVSANYVDVISWPILYGNFISESDVSNNGRVAVLGMDVVEDLWGDRNFNAVGQTVRINDRNFSVIGIMSERGGTFISEDNIVFIPISTAQTRLDNARTRDGGYRLSVIQVEVISEEALDAATAEIHAYLDASHGIIFLDERDYEITSDAGLLETITGITGVLTVFLGMIASISLLVGGIGIMNIMLVSVTERTREIGLRKAVGAQSNDILAQFLIESVVLSLIGGFLGIGLAFIAAYIGSSLYEQLDMKIDLDAMLLATTVSSFVGIFFGYYPARRAAKMKPIDALRFE